MRQEQHAVSPVSFLAHVTRMPKNGLPVVVEADARQRQQLADEHGLLSVERYKAEMLVTVWKRNGVKVEGRVEAAITQACVVSLEPIETVIDEPISSLFLPEDSKLGRLGFNAGGEIMLDAEGPDSPETFSGDSIDVGALAEEFFALAIDPYPRKAGVAVAIGTESADAPEEIESWREKLKGLAGKP